jgi:hypothetical protein
MDTVGTSIKENTIDTIVNFHDRHVFNTAGAILA